jgi:methionyl-tRNA formyltransferase
MLPKQVWSIPKKGTINIHASLLPKYRGAAPIHWAIINGEYETGVTSFLIDEDIDTGAVLMSKKCEIGPNETYGDLHDQLKILGAETAHETCEYLFNNQIIPVNQPKITNQKKAPKLYKVNCRIDWSHSSIDIHNKIRGLSPYPVAWTKFYLKDQEDIIILQIYKASYEIFCHTQNNGDIEISKKELKIFTKDGCIFIKQIQTSGKKRMDIKSFLNGLSSITFKNAF